MLTELNRRAAYLPRFAVAQRWFQARAADRLKFPKTHNLDDL